MNIKSEVISIVLEQIKMYGILFDLDGTLVDSDPIHFEAWQKILQELKPNEPLIDREFFDKHISGRTLLNFFDYFS